MPDQVQAQTPLLTTGLSGLVGSKFEQVFADKYAFEKLDISDPDNQVDITNLEQVKKVVSQSPAKTMIHLAAFTDVSAAWQQNGDENGLAYKVNVTGTENIAKACQENGVHLIHISTAYIFDGEKKGLYTEADPIKPIEWYGETKAKAEEIVAKYCDNWTILRIDFPFRSDNFAKPDILRKTMEAVKNGTPLFSNHFFGPTYIDDLAKVFNWFVNTKTNGLFHASSGESWSDFEFAKEIIKQHNLDLEVKEGNLEDYLKTLNRPYQKNTAMDSSKLKGVLDFELIPIPEALKQVEL